MTRMWPVGADECLRKATELMEPEEPGQRFTEFTVAQAQVWATMAVAAATLERGRGGSQTNM